MTPEEINGSTFQKSTAGNKIKETGTFNWVEGSVSATNESGFTALPGGSRYISSYSSPTAFGGEGEGASWWSSSVLVPSGGILSHWIVNFAGWILKSDMISKNYGLNVRCVKD